MQSYNSILDYESLLLFSKLYSLPMYAKSNLCHSVTLALHPYQLRTKKSLKTNFPLSLHHHFLSHMPYQSHLHVAVDSNPVGIALIYPLSHQLLMANCHQLSKTLLGIASHYSRIPHCKLFHVPSYNPI